MQARFTGTEGRLGLGPDFGFDTTAADRSSHLAVFEEEHFRTTLLRCRTTRVRHSSHDDAFTAGARVVDQAIQVELGNGGHPELLSRVVRVLLYLEQRLGVVCLKFAAKSTPAHFWLAANYFAA